jgi:Holliday junction resolvase
LIGKLSTQVYEIIMTYARRTDANHKDITKVFRDAGAYVIDLSRVGKGCPDLCIGYGGLTVLVEIKSSEKAKYTEDQEFFLQGWQGGAVCRINDIQGAQTLIGLIDAESSASDQ